MATKLYTIEDLLIGKTYRSNSVTGEIISAEKHPNAVWYQDCESYLVEVMPNSGYNNFGRRTYRTVAVKTTD